MGILAMLNLNVAADGRLALEGPNGSGKTTIVKLLSATTIPLPTRS
jgi:ABC-type molybdenum transport system ATPase subunit/photorepair protein PhrA